MAARFIPIIIQVKDADRGVAEVGKVDNAFKKLDRDVDNIGKKGAIGNPFDQLTKSMNGTTVAGNGMSNVLSKTWLGMAAGAIIVAPLVAALKSAATWLFNLTREVTDNILAQHKLATQTGFTQTTISGLTNAAELANVQAGSLNTTLGIFDKNLQAVREGNTGLGVAFKSLNINITNNETALRSAFKSLSELRDGYTRTAAAQRLFGEGGKDVLLIVEETNGDIDAAIKQYRAFGSLVGGPTVAEAKKFHREMVLADQQLEQVKITIARELMPEFSRMATGFSDWLRANKGEWKSWGSAVVAAIRLVVATSPLLQGLGALVSLSRVLGLTKGAAPPKPEEPDWVRGHQLVTEQFRPSWRRWNAADSNVDLGLTTDRDTSGARSAATRKADRDREIIVSMREVADDLANSFQEEFGKALQFRFGQTPLHSKLNYDHRAAFDIPLDPRTSEGQFIMQFLQDRGINFRASLGPEVSKTTGKTISTGPHIHAGSLSGAIGRGLIASEGLLTPKAVRDQIAAEQDRAETFAQVERNRRARELAPIETEAGPFAQLPVKLQRQWDLYYEDVDQREKALRDRREDFGAEYLANQKNLATEIGNLELDLAHIRAQNADDQLTEQRRLLLAKGEQVGLERQLQAVQDDIATGPYNESLRIQLALLQDIASIRRRDEEAIKDQNRARLELADAEVFHAEQARAIVSRHLLQSRSQTEIFADAIIDSYEAINDVVYQGIQKLTGGIRVLDNLIAGLISRLVNRVFQKLLDVLIPGGGGAQPSGGGGGVGGVLGGFLSGGRSAGGGGGGGGFLGSLAGLIPGLGGGGGSFLTGGFAGGSGAATYVGQGGRGTFDFFSGISVPASLSSQTASQSAINSAVQQAGPGAAAGAGAASLTAGLGPAIGAMLPFLGLSVGAGLGGQSRFGQVLGGAGGLLAGGIGAAFLAPSIFASTGVFGALGGPIAGLLTNPFTAIAAGALLLGAFLLSRNARRKQEEKIRDAASTTTLGQIFDLLRAAQRGEVTLPQAQQQFEQIHQSYLQSIAGIKDSKTKKHALLWWDYVAGTKVDPGGATVAIWPHIEKAAREGEAANLRKQHLLPEFSGGMDRGLVPYTGHPMTLIKVRPQERIDDVGLMKSWIVPGIDRGVDSVLTVATPKSRVLTKQQQDKIPGFAGGTPSALAGAGPIELTVNLNAELAVGKDKASQIFVTGAESSDGRKVVVKINRSARLSGEL